MKFAWPIGSWGKDAKPKFVGNLGMGELFESVVGTEYGCADEGGRWQGKRVHAYAPM